MTWGGALNVSLRLARRSRRSHAWRGGTVKISGSLAPATLTPVTTERRASLVAGNSTPKAANSIMFSAAARSRADAAAHPRWGALSVRVHAEPAVAEQVAFDLAHNVQQELLDITEWIEGKGPIRYTATGKPHGGEQGSLRRDGKGLP